MLYRKIESFIRNHLVSKNNKILLIEGARQIGKTYIIRKVSKELFPNYIEINFVSDATNAKIFENVKSVDDFYFALSTVAGDKMKERDNTIVFLDEIQEYPQFITLLKFLREDNRFEYIASGSLLGVTLAETTSIPIGSILHKRMYQLDFEEFLIANGFSQSAIDSLEEKFRTKTSLDPAMHEKMMDLFKKYLIVGGLPDCVNTFISTRNVMDIRQIQTDITNFYKADAGKRDEARKLKIRRIYEMLPAVMQNVKKRIVVKDIEGIKGKRYVNYVDEFDYLINSGISNEVKSVSTPVYPLCQTQDKNLLKLYMNDVGLLSNLLFRFNTKPILETIRSINLGALYETVVASQLKALGHNLFYYDNRNNGEVDFLIDDYENLAVLPIEVKSGRDYMIHSAIDRFLRNPDYPVARGVVLSNDREIKDVDKITYYPIYFVMFFRNTSDYGKDMIL
ncbi:MAG: ATP-binding protein [Ruminococcaceae bacterium]|nr:ATP-binding protein [Oscillospiraceae bacterium]